MKSEIGGRLQRRLGIEKDRKNGCSDGVIIEAQMDRQMGMRFGVCIKRHGGKMTRINFKGPRTPAGFFKL